MNELGYWNVYFYFIETESRTSNSVKYKIQIDKIGDCIFHPKR